MFPVQSGEMTLFLALEKQTRIDSVHTRTVKIVLYMKDPASGPYRGTVGREFFFEFVVTDPPRGRPVGGGGIHRN